MIACDFFLSVFLMVTAKVEVSSFNLFFFSYQLIIIFLRSPQFWILTSCAEMDLKIFCPKILVVILVLNIFKCDQLHRQKKQ